jgi:hypothetical protein
MSEEVFLAALGIVFGSFVVMSIARIGRAYFENRGRETPPAFRSDLEERLRRIEAVVESTALEVERIAESNRFMSKLLAERAGSIGTANLPARVTTPH